MISNNPPISKSTVGLAWYRVPILWLMISLLSFTVISGVYLFFLAHDTNDMIITDKNYVPLDKKQAHSKKSNTEQPR